MARHKNVEWNLPENGPTGAQDYQAIHAAILMDIRDELRQMNMLAIAVVRRAYPDLLVPVKTASAAVAGKNRAAKRKTRA